MTIKQQGGVFGRNPTFNDVTVDGTLSTGGALSTGGIISTTSNIVIEAGSPNIRFAETDTTDQNYRIRVQAGQFIFEKLADDNSIVTECFRVDSSNNLDLKTGSLAVANGQGIDFSATSGTGTSELFSDYEEGTFDVTFLPQTSGSITINSSYNTMSYTKVGRVVTITGEIRVDSVSSPVGNYFVIRNLPFVVADLTDSAGRSSGNCYFYDGTYATASFKTVENQTYIRINVDASTITAGNEFAFSFSYPAA